MKLIEFARGVTATGSLLSNTRCCEKKQSIR